MLHLLLGLCIGLLPALIATLLITLKVNRESKLLRERLAAEEASKRHFIQQTSQHEATIALMYQEQKRLEVELACRQAVSERIAA